MTAGQIAIGILGRIAYMGLGFVICVLLLVNGVI